MKKWLLVYLCLSCYSFVDGQDDFFTSYRTGAWIINPAETGRIEGQSRVVMAARTQWLTISKQAFYATYAGVESQIFCLGQNFFGAGIMLVTEQAGISFFQRSYVMPSFSYHQQLNNQIYLAAGLKIGLLQHKLGNQQLSFNSQFNGIDYDPSLSNRENFDQLNAIKPDAEAGILIYNNNGKWSFGIAFDHLLTPNMSFLQEGKDELGIGLKLHGNYAITDFIGIHAMYKDYALVNNRQWHSLVGVYGKIFDHLKTELSFRLTDRIGADAAIFGIFFSTEKWDLGVNYDAGISTLTKGTYGFNGVEVFGSILLGSKKPCVNCPKF
jgi:type IX secretion system PorP/SprF family membrane protein